MRISVVILHESMNRESSCSREKLCRSKVSKYLEVFLSKGHTVMLLKRIPRHYDATYGDSYIVERQAIISSEDCVTKTIQDLKVIYRI